MIAFRIVRLVVTRIIIEWKEDRGWLLSAALAFYSLFSLAPILIIVVAGLGLIVGWSDAEVRVIDYLRSLTGEAGTRLLEKVVIDIEPVSKNILAALTGFGALFIGASTFFVQLRHALDQIWKIPHPPGKRFLGFFKDRLAAFLLALATGILVLISLLSTTFLAAFAEWIKFTSGNTIVLWRIFDPILSYSILTIAFGLLYKFVPDAHVRLSDVWIGAAGAALLFTVAKYLFGLYLHFSTISSAYGAAGSLVVFLLWLNIAAQIFLLGAECVEVIAKYRGHTLKR